MPGTAGAKWTCQIAPETFEFNLCVFLGPSGGWLAESVILVSDSTGLWDLFLVAAVFVIGWIVLRTSSMEISMILGNIFDLTIPLQYHYHPRLRVTHRRHLDEYWPVFLIGTIAEGACYFLLHPDLFTLVVCLKTYGLTGMWILSTRGIDHRAKPPKRRQPPPSSQSTVRDRLGRHGFGGPEVLDSMMKKFDALGPDEQDKKLEGWLRKTPEQVKDSNKIYQKELDKRKKPSSSGRTPKEDIRKSEKGRDKDESEDEREERRQRRREERKKEEKEEEKRRERKREKRKKEESKGKDVEEVREKEKKKEEIVKEKEEEGKKNRKKQPPETPKPKGASESSSSEAKERLRAIRERYVAELEKAGYTRDEAKRIVYKLQNMDKEEIWDRKMAIYTKENSDDQRKARLKSVNTWLKANPPPSK